MNDQNEELKSMLTDLDLSRLEELERQRQEAAANTEGAVIGGDGNQGQGPNVVNTTVNMGGRQFKLTGRF